VKKQEMIAFYFKIVSRIFYENTEEDHEKFQGGLSLAGIRTEHLNYKRQKRYRS
jgi:hypothetical protein